MALFYLIFCLIFSVVFGGDGVFVFDVRSFCTLQRSASKHTISRTRTHTHTRRSICQNKKEMRFVVRVLCFFFLFVFDLFVHFRFVFSV